MVNIALEAEDSLIITKTVDELLFHGYEDNLLEILNKIPLIHLPFDKFGWFYGVSLLFLLIEKKNYIYFRSLSYILYIS